MQTLWIISAALLAAAATPATAQDRPVKPMSPGHATRPDNWNNDGAPPPPRVWQGQGGTRWTDHYHACRNAYGRRYNYRTDLVRHGGRSRRCTR